MKNKSKKSWPTRSFASSMPKEVPLVARNVRRSQRKNTSVIDVAKDDMNINQDLNLEQELEEEIEPFSYDKQVQ